MQCIIQVFLFIFLTLAGLEAKNVSLASHHLEQLKKIQTVNQCLKTYDAIIQEKLTDALPEHAETAKASILQFYEALDTFEKTTETLEDIAWKLYPLFVRAYCLLDGLEKSTDKHYDIYQYKQGFVEPTLNSLLLEAFDEVKHIPFFTEDTNDSFSSPIFPQSTVDTLNDAHRYLMLEDTQINALQPIINSLKEEVTKCLGHYWKVATVRAWKTPPIGDGVGNEFGPNEWHVDGGLVPGTVKIMYYPKGISRDKGSIALRVAGEFGLKSDEGTWVLFEAGQVVHKAVFPVKEERLAIEITVIPAICYDLFAKCAGQNTNLPRLPWQQLTRSAHPLYKVGEKIGVNIGGGAYWSYPQWVNLEEAHSPANPITFQLTPTCRFPFENKAVQHVYTSHCIEHLNIPTVYRIFSETHRILEEGGDFIIKIPDYDKTLDCWKHQDNSFFDYGWGIEGVSHTWKTKGLEDCLDLRAAMIFCSFYTDSYGNPFQPGDDPKVNEPYFGPPVVSVEYLQELIKDASPGEIAKELRKIIARNEKNFSFCHQTAWSQDEMTALLNLFGFEVVTYDPDEVIDRFPNIPAIRTMKEQSLYCLAKKKSKTKD